MFIHILFIFLHKSSLVQVILIIVLQVQQVDMCHAGEYSTQYHNDIQIWYVSKQLGSISISDKMT